MAVLAWLPSIGASDPKPRILSLDLCTDWMLAKYASRAQVVALSPTIHRYPIDWIDRDWPTHNGTLEQILELNPDLVLTGEYNALLLRERLRTLGVRIEILPLPKSLDDIQQYEQQILGLLKSPIALPSHPTVLPHTNTSGKRLLILGANGIGTGQGTFEQDILVRAGWKNYLQEEGYIHLDLEQLVNDPPDAILWASPNSEALANRFSKHAALRKAIPEQRWLTTDYWRWQCPGPWTWELITQLNQWID